MSNLELIEFDEFLNSKSAFINADQNRWNLKSSKKVDISMVFAFSFGTFIKGLENTFVTPQWN